MDLIQKHRLVQSLNHGDPAAFRQIAGLLTPGLRHYLRRFTQQAPELDELVSDVLLKIWLKKGSFQDWGQLRGFLHVVARHAGIDQLKKLQRQQRNRMISLDRLDIPESGPAELSTEQELLFEKLLQAIAQLPKKRRIIIELIYLGGYRAEEVAEQLGITIKTVRNQQYRAQKQLRFLVGPKEFFWAGMVAVPWALGLYG